MAEVIEMPRLSDTMEEGVIAAWHKKVGDEVSSGDLLTEIETDKATMDFESPEDGVLLHIGVEEGKGIPVGSLLAIIGGKDEDISAILASYSNGSGNGGAPAATPTPEVSQPSEPTPVATASAAVAVAAPVATAVSNDAIKASPLAKAMAKERGIDLAQVAGSGDNGRIVKRDIENFQPSATPAVKTLTPSTPLSSPLSELTAQGAFEEVGLSQMRKTIARRLSESKFTAPHFYVTMDIDMGNVVAVRKQLNEISPVKISFNDIIIRATASALRQHPQVNASWQGDKIRYNHEIHIGMAVAVEEGLLVPVIRNADAKTFSQIATETKDLAGKARERKLDPSAWTGNTFSISNLGMFGVEEFTAIINPPDACILAVGGIRKEPVVKDDEIVIGHRMKVTLSCDHRVVDGATGAAFLVTLREMLEDPMRMLV
ncbi:MAG: pyruvate dehydrogenase complex dihydrolipoamide acetyltransferase [Bacteroidota bacterium]